MAKKAPGALVALAEQANPASGGDALDALLRELAADGAVPSAGQLAALAGADPADPDSAPVGRHPWRLFADRALPELAAEALQIATPLQLALAVRAWEPNLELAGIYPRVPRAERDLRDLRRHARALSRRIAAMQRADPQNELELRRPDGTRAPALVALTTRLAATSRWSTWRSRHAEAEADAIASARGPVDAKLSPRLERAVSAAKRRWWLPVADLLQDHLSWGRDELAQLLLSEIWIVDLVPRLRARLRATYDGPGNAPELLRAITDARRDPRRRAAQKAPRAR